MITKEILEEALNYKEYILLLEELLKLGRTTGPIQSEDKLNAAKINLQRMRRLDKTIVLSQELLSAAKKIKNQHLIVILTEGWCGDAAQNIPIFAAIEKQAPQLEVLYILRDEHPEIMDQYLTNGTRSIPKAICVEKESMAEKFSWGPRPQALQQQVEDLLKRNVPKADKGLFVQTWYNNDKTETTQKELAQLILSLN
jgi:hypothetical protein